MIHRTCFADCNTDVVAVKFAIGKTETDGGTDANVGFNPIAFGLTEEFCAPLELDVTEGFFVRLFRLQISNLVASMWCLKISGLSKLNFGMSRFGDSLGPTSINRG